ncbi:MAG: protein kinase [Planctomycetales bacterium]|nr:protein kinase [Planctomycetales bacterium]
MKPNAPTCPIERLEALLSGTLSTVDEAQVSNHLEQCPSCQRQLESLAAAEECWQRASNYLRDDPRDLSSISQLDIEQPAIPAQIAQVLDALDPTDDPAMLGRLGGYEISGAVGAGGMGVVLKGIDRALDRTVAIKVMAPHLATSGAARQRFSREARAAAAVIHPNVIAIHSVCTDAALPFLVMPYVGGASLQKRIDSEGALPVADILRIGIQIAAGLSAAHHQGLVHRDIKPANILLDKGIERLVITDFGLARAVDDASMTRTGVIAGTPQFMSPEQARGEAIDARSDLFSLGSVLYTLCTGRVPFRVDSALAVLRRITDSESRPIGEINPAIPPWLIQVVERLHAKTPQQRYPSAAHVAELLTDCLAHLNQAADHPLPEELRTGSQQHAIPSERSQRFAATLGAAMGVAIAMGLLVAGVFTISTFNWFSVQDTKENDLAKPSKIDVVSPARLLPADKASSSTTKVDSPNAIPLPWEAEESKLQSWDDQLGPVLEHINQRILESNAL